MFKKCDWTELYYNAEEMAPINFPKPSGKEVDIDMFVDSDYAEDRRFGRSKIGFLIYVNTALVYWYSKKQSSVETSVFGADFVTMKQGTDAHGGLRHNLRMMDISILGSCNIYWDKMSGINNTMKTETVLKKKRNPVWYHALHESVAIIEALVGHIPSSENIVDMMMKVTCS